MDEEKLYVRDVKLVYFGRRRLAKKLESPAEVYKRAKRLIGKEIQEHFLVFAMNNKNVEVGHKVVTVGTISEALIHPREIFRYAIELGAASVIIAHNHPTGVLSPSREDDATTERLKEAGKIVGIPVLDHIIVTLNGYYSYKEGGKI